MNKLFWKLILLVVFVSTIVNAFQKSDGRIEFIQLKVSQPATVQGYVVDEYFTNSAICRGDSALSTYATSYGACRWSKNADGTIIYNSSKQVVNKVENGTLYYTETYYGEPFDCTGTPFSTYEKSRFVGCKQYSSVNSELFQYVEGDEPWLTTSKGVVEKSYTLSQSCEGLPERWQTRGLGSCLLDPNAPEATDMRYRYTSCTSTEVIKEIYSDTQCKNLVETQKVPLDSCVVRSEYWGDDHIQLACNL